MAREKTITPAVATSEDGGPDHRPEKPAPSAPEPERAPEVARVAAAAALGDTLPLPGMEAAVPPAAEPVKRERKPRDRSRERTGRRPGRRSRAELESENRELRRRAGVPDTAPAVVPAPAPAADPTEAIALVRELVTALFGMVAIDRGPHWNLAPQQADRIALHFGKAVAPHVGNWGEAVPWAFGSLALAGVLRERIAEDKRVRAGGAPRPAAEVSLTPAPPVGVANAPAE